MEGLITVFIVWTMVWVRSDQRSKFGLEGLISSALFFQLFCFFLSRDVGSAKRQQ